MTVTSLDEKRFDPWLVEFNRAVNAVLGVTPPPDDPPVKARVLVAA